MREFQELVNKLTNWQRNQRARMGYPGLRTEDPNPVRAFLMLRPQDWYTPALEGLTTPKLAEAIRTFREQAVDAEPSSTVVG